MPHETSNILAWRQRMWKAMLEVRSRVVDGLQRHVRTGLGVSEGYYCQDESGPRLGGEVQGKADVPTMFAMLSDILLRAHASIAPGLEMDSCNLEHKVKHHSIAFVDNVDGRVTAGPPKEQLEPKEEDTASKIVANLNRAGAIWNSLLEIAGQSAALHKLKWRALLWEMRGGEWVLSVNAPG